MEGYVMPDRHQGLSVEQCYFVLKHLSQFHALSLAMKCHDPEAFYELLNIKDGISEGNGLFSCMYRFEVNLDERIFFLKSHNFSYLRFVPTYVSRSQFAILLYE